MKDISSLHWQFEASLRNIMGDRPLRPFICNGSPLDCKIFIVGFNPATEMEQPFWTFWNLETGFDKHRWFETYKQERATKPLKPGKTRRNLVSNTRQRMEWIVEAAYPIKCLETNLYSTATEAAVDLTILDQDAQIFEFLVREIHPDVIFLHGLDARRYLEKLSGHVIQTEQLVNIPIYSLTTKVLAVSHLSRGWSKAKAWELGLHLRELCLQ